MSRKASCLIHRRASTARGGESSLLGLGFSLRLVRNLAQSAGGSLTISADNIALTLPAAATSKINIRETESE